MVGLTSDNALLSLSTCIVDWCLGVVYSVGLEDEDVLLGDLQQALDHVIIVDNHHQST